MNKVYRSKIDTWIGFILVALPISMTLAIWKLFQVSAQGKWVVILSLLLLGICLPISAFTSTYYKISDTSLTIRGSLFKWEISLNQISAIEPTNDILSSPALSLDRLRIDYGHGKSIMISPVNQAEFLRDLKALNVPSA